MHIVAGTVNTTVICCLHSYGKEVCKVSDSEKKGCFPIQFINPWTLQAFV